MSLCLLGVERQWSESKTLLGLEDLQLVSLGQRAMAKFPFYSVFDRETASATVMLGGATLREQEEPAGYGATVAMAICTFMLIMVVYLISLRYSRIKAEEWLEKNKKILFSHAADLKTEDEILEALVNSKELTTMFQNRHHPSTPR